MKNKLQVLEKFGNVCFTNFILRKTNDKYFVDTESCPKVSLEDLEIMANQLLALVKEIRDKDRFGIGESYFFVHPDNSIRKGTRGATFTSFLQDNLLMVMGNIFKTADEAAAHKEEMLAKFKEVRKKHVKC